MLKPAGFAKFGKLQSDQQRFFTVPLSPFIAEDVVFCPYSK